MSSSPAHEPAPALAPGRRVVVTALGETPDDALAQRFVVEPMDAPDPAALGPRDVLVAVRSAAVGWVDLLMSSGQYQHLVQPPYTPGLEHAGVVAWRGAEADGVQVGERVLVDGFLAGPRSLGPYQRWGGFASWAVAPVEAVHPIPDRLSFDEAAGLLGAYETAYHCLVARGRLRAGETVLVLGATGATGLAAVQLARAEGATVIAVGRSESKLARVAAEGAHHTISLPRADGALVSPRESSASMSLRDRVKALTGGRGVDVVYDAVGGDLSVEALRACAFGARFLIVGWAGTPLVARGKGGRGAPNANLLPTNLVMMKGLDVLGCPAVISTVRDPSIRPPRLRYVLEGARSGTLRPVVSHAFPLDRVHDALRAKWTGQVTGICVLHP